MTTEEREKAIDLLDNLIGAVEDNQGNDYDLALKMAIKSLEQEPCDDAVSRQAVCEFLENHAKTYDDVRVRIGLKAGSSLVANPDNVPSVTPSHKKGEWVKVTNGRGGHECNICHAYAPSYQNGDEHLSEFCPNCGAKMD